MKKMKKKSCAIILMILILCFGLSMGISAKTVYSCLVGASIVEPESGKDYPIGRLYSGLSLDLITETLSNVSVFPDYDKKILRLETDDTKSGYFFPSKAGLYHQNLNKAMTEFFEGAGPDDIAVFYYTGHGNIDRGLVLGEPGSNGNYYRFDSLMADLKACAGQCKYVLVMVDCCYSGKLLNPTERNQYLQGYDNFAVLPAASESEEGKYTYFRRRDGLLETNGQDFLRDEDGYLIVTPDTIGLYGYLGAAIANSLTIVENGCMDGDLDQNGEITIQEFQDRTRYWMQAFGEKLDAIDSIVHPPIDNLGFSAKNSIVMGATFGSLKEAVITVNDAPCTYTGSAVEPNIVVNWHNKLLKEGIDYTVSYSNNTQTGKGKAEIQGIGNFRDSNEAEFLIVPELVLSKTEVSIIKGLSEKIEARVSGCSSANLTWKSDMTSVAKVSDGTVTAAGVGTAKITASFEYEGVTIEKSCSVTVVKKPVPIVLPGSAVSEGKYIYYTYSVGNPRMGIMRLNTKNGAVKEITDSLNNNKQTNGFSELSLKDNYIYATWNQYAGSPESEYYIYRINKNNGKKSKLASGMNPVLAGNYVYYIELSGSGINQKRTGNVMKMKLNGKNQTVVRKLDTNLRLYSDGKEVYYSSQSDKNLRKLSDDTAVDYKKGFFIANDGQNVNYHTYIDTYEYYCTGGNFYGKTVYRKNRNTGKMNVVASVTGQSSISNYRVIGDYVLVFLQEVSTSGGYKSTTKICCYTGDGKLVKTMYNAATTQ